jgi:hypothetical protein
MSRAFVIFGRVVAIACIIVGIAAGIWPSQPERRPLRTKLF